VLCNQIARRDELAAAAAACDGGDPERSRPELTVTLQQ